jgi:hypothetical protein
MPMFHVEVHRSGPEYDSSLSLEEQSGWDVHARFMDALVATRSVVLGGPLDDDYRVILAIEAESEEAIRTMLGEDPWAGSHLVIYAIDRWTIRLDARKG